MNCLYLVNKKMKGVNFKDLTGTKIGKITAISYRYEHRKYVWVCICECGRELELIAARIKRKSINGCNVCSAPIFNNHAFTKTKEYIAWTKMNARCNDKSKAKYYLLNGVKVCDRWKGKDGFSNFFKDMGNAPTSKHSLDRIDNNGSYDPSNCRWATQKDQCLNRSSNIFIEYNGTTKALREWAEYFNIPYRKLHHRMYALKWEFKEAIKNT